MPSSMHSSVNMFQVHFLAKLLPTFNHAAHGEVCLVLAKSHERQLEITLLFVLPQALRIPQECITQPIASLVGLSILPFRTSAGQE